ncbi:MAG: LysR family transcriptional regulator [Rhodobacteraceae bacterium]|nr:LysR family transcriptional regulator [Paracoccaceae bacterium]
MDWSRIPSLSSLRAFEAAARRGSFTQAAAELNVTQAAITQSVRGLERDLSEVLITRKGRGIDVTPKGRLLAESLREGFGQIAEGVEAIRAENEARPLRLSATPGFATHWLMPRLGDFWTRHPDIELSITPSTEVVDLRRDGFDMAIRYGSGHWPGTDAELLTDGDFWVVARADLVKDSKAECLEDAGRLPWLIEGQMQEGRELVEREGLDLDTVDLRLLTTNTLVLSAVNAGLGVSVQAKTLVEDDVRRGQLALICALNHENYGYYIVTIPGREARGLRTLTRWLRDQARETAE